MKAEIFKHWGVQQTSLSMISKQFESEMDRTF